MSLEKAKLQPLHENGNNKGEAIAVMYNPAEYSMQRANQFSETPLLGLQTPIRQFSSGGAKSLTLDLFFDTYEKGTDVREYTNKVESLLDIDSDLHAPPVLNFLWGGPPFKCVLEQLAKKFTLFFSSGIPARATLSCTFKEYVTIAEQLQKKPRNSSDRTKYRTAIEGDSLWLLASREYNDPAEWRTIASANGIQNPRYFESGKDLKLPPLA